MTTQILIVEDQQDIRDLICLSLESIDAKIQSTEDGLEGFEMASTGNFDLIVLDLMLPSMDGLAVCRALRAKKITTPILMLTARNSEFDRVQGLDIGADDYLTKPFSVLELNARAKALMRRAALTQAPTDTQKVLDFGQLRIDAAKRQVTLDLSPIQLTAKEFDLLFHLAKSPDKVFSREQLLNIVWGYDHTGYEHTVNSHINRLRGKLETNTSNVQYIQTVWGVGYKFSTS